MKKLFFGIITLLLLAACTGTGEQNQTSYEKVSPDFCADSAFAYIEAQCAFGPRTMNSAAHDSCALWIERQFKRLGCEVSTQDAELTLYDGTKVNSRNIIARINPQAAQRIIICSHWDSRPWADHDSDEANHRTPIAGANDGASGVGVLIELARMMQKQAPPVGIDLVCFDAEDCGTPQWADDGDDHQDTWCLGSQYWAQNPHADATTFRYAILLDMVGGANSIFRKEAFSMRNAPRVVDHVWSVGQSLGYTDLFLSEEGGGVTDDHLQIINAGIPAIDIIANNSEEGYGFNATWHTVGDTPANIDRHVLQAVGQTVAEVIFLSQP